MENTPRRAPLLAAILTLFLLALPSAAAHAASGDVEIDPIAYALDGHSMHVGLRLNHQRFDLGNFAAAVPAAFHGNDGFDVYFRPRPLK